MIVNKFEKLERIKGGSFFMLLKKALAAFGWDTQLGAQYDPSQLSTLFVDEAGTTSPPSSTGLSAKTDLENLGWTVTVETA